MKSEWKKRRTAENRQILKEIVGILLIPIIVAVATLIFTNLVAEFNQIIAR